LLDLRGEGFGDVVDSLCGIYAAFVGQEVGIFFVELAGGRALRVFAEKARDIAGGLHLGHADVSNRGESCVFRVGKRWGRLPDLLG